VKRHGVAYGKLVDQALKLRSILALAHDVETRVREKCSSDRRKSLDQFEDPLALEQTSNEQELRVGTS